MSVSLYNIGPALPINRSEPNPRTHGDIGWCYSHKHTNLEHVQESEYLHTMSCSTFFVNNDFRRSKGWFTFSQTKAKL